MKLRKDKSNPAPGKDLLATVQAANQFQLKRTWGSWWTVGSRYAGLSSVPGRQRRPVASWSVLTGAETGG